MVEVEVFGDDDQAMLLRVSPNGRIVTRLEADVPNVDHFIKQFAERVGDPGR